MAKRNVCGTSTNSSSICKTIGVGNSPSMRLFCAIQTYYLIITTEAFTRELKTTYTINSNDEHLSASWFLIPILALPCTP